MNNIQTNQSQSSKVKAVIIGIVIVIVAGALVWSLKVYKKPASADKITPAATLGGQIYKQATNPIQNKLPDTVAPVPNPIQNTYKNPFQ